MELTYRAISKIYGHSKQTSTLTGSNLAQTIVGKHYAVSGAFVDYPSRVATNLIDTTNNKTLSVKYTAESGHGKSMLYQGFDADGNTTERQIGLLGREDSIGGTYTGTITVSANTAKIGLSFYNNSDASAATLKSITNLQVNYGSTLLPYEPYIGGTPSPNPYHPELIRNISKLNLAVTRNGKVVQEASIVPPFNMNGIGEHRDVCNAADGEWESHAEEFTSEMLERLAKGTEFYPENPNQIAQRYYVLTAQATEQNYIDNSGFSDRWSVANTGGAYASINQFRIMNGRTLYVRLPLSIADTAQKFTDWVTANPFKVLVVRKEKKTIPVSSSDLEILNSIKLHRGEELHITDQYGDDVEFELVEKEFQIGEQSSLAIPNRVVVGDEDDPILVFENNNIIAVVEDTGTSAIGDELFIDTFMPTVRYELFIRYRIVPKNVEEFQGIKSADGKIVGSKWNYDVRNIPYGTPIRFYSNGKNAGLYYCDDVQRIAKEQFQINCVSAVGMMNKQRHVGGVYTGQTFSEVLSDITGGEYEYEIESDVAGLQVYGWLPYDTRRRNLHQLLVAYGVTITKSDTGGMLFTFINASQSYTIPSARVFSGGTVQYGEPASRVEVTEHSYHYLSIVEEEQLFDSQGADVPETLVTFDHPIYPDSIRALANDDGLITMTIVDKGTNFALVKGTGVLVGKPYVHNTRLLVETNKSAVTEKVVTVENATLITMSNSDNAVARISNYYFNAVVVSQDIRVDDERTGRRYDVINPFNETTTGFMSRMVTHTSSFRRAQCELITDYTPIASGASFGHMTLKAPTDEITWYIPESVYEKDVPQVRFTLIGRGEDGRDGENGHDGENSTDSDGGLGGAGGKGGSGGRGGRIFSTTVDCENLAFVRMGRTADGEMYLKVGDNQYSSANGQRSPSGFVEIFTGAVYALSGSDGFAGAGGGRGGRNPAIGISPYSAEKGEDLEYNGITYKGGKGAPSQNVNGGSYGISSNLTLKFGGGGGGGAAVGNNGQDGTVGLKNAGTFDPNLYYKQPNGMGRGKGGNGGDGADAVTTTKMYGFGGNGGHGGGGGGGADNLYWWNHEYSTLISTDHGRWGYGGKGGKGGIGQDGCIIIYY